MSERKIETYAIHDPNQHITIIFDGKISRTTIRARCSYDKIEITCSGEPKLIETIMHDPDGLGWGKMPAKTVEDVEKMILAAAKKYLPPIDAEKIKTKIIKQKS